MIYRLLIASLLLPAITSAQVAPNPDYAAPPLSPAYRWVLKVAPLSLFDPDNTVQVAAERRIGRSSAVQLEFGYGWQGMNLWNLSGSAYSDRQVWRARAEYRYYLQRNAPIGLYVAVDGFFKQVNAREDATLGIGCNTGPCQYYQLYSQPVQKNVVGGHLKIGRQVALADGRLLVDFYVGLGVRYRFFAPLDRPEDTYLYRSHGFNLFNSFYAAQLPWTSSLAYGFKIGYALGR